MCQNSPIPKNSGPTVDLRPARAADCARLSDLAMRSKASWGYDADFMAACAHELTITPARLQRETIFVAERAGLLLGMCGLDDADGKTWMELMFVDPDQQSGGVGRRLFDHALGLARARGATQIDIQSDPGAEGFYLRMGARRIGTLPSASIPRRSLPLLRIDLD